VVAVADVFYSDAQVVQPDDVPAADPEPDQLVDAASRGDREMRAGVGQLTELRVRVVRGESVEDLSDRSGNGVMLDDLEVLLQAPFPLAVMTLRVPGHLMLAFDAERNQLLADLWLDPAGAGPG